MDRRHFADRSVASLLLSWQATGDASRLERLIEAVLPELEQVAGSVLHRHRIADPAAIDDAVSLVLDHLRRLPASVPAEHKVAPFVPRESRGGTDAGLIYVRWLAKERAHDVARASRRRERHVKPFSRLDDTGHDILHDVAAPAAPAGPGGPDVDDCDRLTQLQQVIPHLEPRLGTVLRMLLEGEPQTVIAARLQVCEGTVSRMRVRAIEQAREALHRQ